jgi:hypothetical protein
MNLMLRSCGYRGDVADVAEFLFFNCADAIRRPVLIHKRDRLTVEATGYVSDRNNTVPTICSWFPAMSPASYPA